MGSIEQVLQLSSQEKKRYAQQKTIMRVAVHTPLRDDVALSEGTPGPINHDVKSKMGVKDIKLYAPLAEDLSFRSHRVLVDGIKSTSDVTNAKIVSKEDDANIIFLPGSDTVALPGMFAYSGSYHRGVNGVATRESRKKTAPQMSTEELWRTLGYSATKYAIQPVTEDGRHIGYDQGSMEGALHHTDVSSGYVDFTQYLGYMAASEYVTKHEVAEGVELAEGEIPPAMMQVMKMCTALRKNKFMPPLDLEDIVPKERTEAIKRFLGQSGLSTGNASFWDSKENLMMITASGVDKANLKRHEVLRVLGFTDSFEGVRVQPYKFNGNVRTSKTSVESFSNLATFWGAIGTASGDITDGSLDQILGFIQDEELVKARLAEGSQPKYTRQLHFHAHPIAWNPRLVTVLEPNANLVHNGDSHASCGTRPEAYYTTEMAVRGMLYNGNEPKIIIAKMQKHGSEIISPFDLERTLHILNPYRTFPDILFAPVDMAKNNSVI